MLKDDRIAQIEQHDARAYELGEAMLQGSTELEKLGDVSYQPPASDDWHEWRGMTKWCALDRRYRYHIETLALLKLDKGPYHCPICEESPGRGWVSRACVECAWDNLLADEALQLARGLDPARKKKT